MRPLHFLASSRKKKIFAADVRPESFLNQALEEMIIDRWQKNYHNANLIPELHQFNEHTQAAERLFDFSIMRQKFDNYALTFTEKKPTLVTR